MLAKTGGKHATSYPASERSTPETHSDPVPGQVLAVRPSVCTGGILRTSRRYGWPAANELPGTLQRSCQEAQATFLKAREEAIRVHGEGDDAYRAAYAVLKQKFEKCGDHWIAKVSTAT
jgi:hypothetical protein